MKHLAPVLTLTITAACTPQEEGKDKGPVHDTAHHLDTGETGQDTCEEDAAGSLPGGVTWLSHETSGRARTFADQYLTDSYTGYEATYNLNALEVYAANGFKLDGKATLYGARVRWANIQAPFTPATITAWPDFSSDGYAFDVWNPYGTATLCVGPDDEGEEMTYVFPEPIEVGQPIHVFVGFHRPEVLPSEDGVLQFTEPEIPWHTPLTGGFEEPYEAGVRWPEMDPTYMYGGTISPWYVLAVELAVVYDDSLAPEDKPFQLDEVLSASSRVAWGDYDNDGDDDLMTNGPTLYRNEGDGTFTNVTGEAIPSGINSSGGGVWGDYDNDGCLDYFGQGGGYNAGEVLLHNNCDGTFSDAWPESGLVTIQDERDCDGDGEPEYSPTQGSAWFDYDGDGYLDLYLANYECSSEHDYYKNYDDHLFRNNGDGTFADVSSEVGIRSDNHAGRGVTTGDYDRDGDTDLFVSNYRLDPNFFYLNEGDGVLTEVAGDNGTVGDYNSTWRSYGHTIGSVFGDIDNDGDFDLITANLAHPFYYHFSNLTQVLINDGDGNFTDEAEARGIYFRETHSSPVLFDADNDGDLDLFITCVYSGRDSDFYENDGTGHFTLRNWESGLVVQNGWGAAASDFDNDGDVDILAYSLFRNDLQNDNRWLQVGVGGCDGNASAIGAVIQVETTSGPQLRHVSGGSGTSTQDSLVQHFGLGLHGEAEAVTVWFPYQEAPVVVENVPADQRIWIWSDGSHATGTAPAGRCSVPR